MDIYDSTMEEYTSTLHRFPILRKNDEKREIPFKYNDTESYQLLKLRQTYSLDEIIAQKNELDSVLALTQWTFEQLFCIGENISPHPMNALNILAHRKEGALFCVHKAIVLNEALTSVGISSRLLWCYPHKYDGDCHVVVIAFLTEMSKWVFIDPSFNTFFTDEQGVPLSPLEIRAKYEEGLSPLFGHIAIDKSWALYMNGIECDTYDQFYRIYMAKNIFRFSSPKSNPCDLGAPEGVCRVYLNPYGFTSVNAYDNEPKDKNRNVYTTDPNVFFGIIE